MIVPLADALAQLRAGDLPRRHTRWRAVDAHGVFLASAPVDASRATPEDATRYFRRLLNGRPFTLEPV